ncbi:bifunctional DNA-formamidopyrimidine glycosylase/DNA-(apurinic or apyrimidinic site) lyase [Gordonia terrae]|uniref:bifunctional DNA-formamidopyrimidine glycosylase/DNA-(apurinic or apyrimidinic site) lyase n=1 Tax=Gordonia terrae TaxID=2055 RepID=UPI00200A0A26|nr:bifunctional DNA-formamidopyrimidine glycosylase/DNA-(apurinic or apyrimidinic site) lyase [Gordonia terrae]UPW11166.1 bifunctional DNA-formamidopyrimidine glycosylase/DNA-(apurinic or apyrimidinic site) lyase [Gordonia terrae]
MPELPEVETVRSGLETHLVGRVVTSTEVLHPRAIRRHAGGEPDLIGRLAGKQVTGVRRRGKYLWIDLADSTDRAALVVHLGMSGQMLIARVGTPDHTHLRVRAVLDDENELRFVDQRTFGGWHLDDYTPDVYAPQYNSGTTDAASADVPISVAHIATDPFDPAFDPGRVVERMRAKHSEIKRVLLDQTVISGVGNIYADEALWRARLHGARVAETISRKKLRELIDAVTEVMAAALKVGGTSFDALYVNVNGQSGYFERSLNAYGRAGEPCRRCGAIMRREQFMNRSSFFCPRCQRPPSERSNAR